MGFAGEGLISSATHSEIFRSPRAPHRAYSSRVIFQIYVLCSLLFSIDDKGEN